MQHRYFAFIYLVSNTCKDFMKFMMYLIPWKPLLSNEASQENAKILQDLEPQNLESEIYLWCCTFSRDEPLFPHIKKKETKNICPHRFILSEKIHTKIIGFLCNPNFRYFSHCTWKRGMYSLMRTDKVTIDFLKGTVWAT